jgi:hypothetical protein
MWNLRERLKKQEEEKQNRPIAPLLPFGLRRGMLGQMFNRSPCKRSFFPNNQAPVSGPRGLLIDNPGHLREHEAGSTTFPSKVIIVCKPLEISSEPDQKQTGFPGKNSDAVALSATEH